MSDSKFINEGGTIRELVQGGNKAHNAASLLRLLRKQERAIKALTEKRHTPAEVELIRVRGERQRQDAKWGKQVHPDLDPKLMQGNAEYTRICDELKIPTAEESKHACDTEFAHKNGSWSVILLEEFCEVIEQAHLGDLEELRMELTQVAAVAVQWSEEIASRHHYKEREKPWLNLT